jgi:hypothetical protein
MKPVTSAHIDLIRDIMRTQDQVKEHQVGVRDAIKALADQLETKPARVNAIIRLVRKEQTEPGALEFEQDTLDAAEKVAR